VLHLNASFRAIAIYKVIGQSSIYVARAVCSVAIVEYDGYRMDKPLWLVG
jgi:hypothetical protein